MITKKQFQDIALSLPYTEEVPHFDRRGFKVADKRLFASYYEKDNTANIFLTPKEQKMFCRMDKTNIYPVPNKWGENGATTFALDTVAKELVQEALLSAYKEVLKPKPRPKAPKKSPPAGKS